MVHALSCFFFFGQIHALNCLLVCLFSPKGLNECLKLLEHPYYGPITLEVQNLIDSPVLGSYLFLKIECIILLGIRDRLIEEVLHPSG